MIYMAVAGVPEVSSSSISRYNNYHVFLSFRGADTRKNFTDHLYAALVQAGFRTFRDDNEIERGENIRDEIYRAILDRSKMSLIVFSKNYASSTWCLDELVKIIEHRKSSPHIALPIFYDVDPSQVKNQTGSFAEAFAKHEECFKSEMDMVQRWRAALKEVADLGGMVLQDRHESQFIQDIVKQVQHKLQCNALYVPPFLVGIDLLLTKINWWLEDGSNKVNIAAIFGIGGIGKTTIAKVVYNQNMERFEGYSFLAGVRETCQERNGLVRLQRQLISDVLKGKAKKIYNPDDAITKIKDAICSRRVLLVLDDVDDPEKITKIVGSQLPFHPGSKIIITSRHRHLLRDPFITQLFDLEASASHGDLFKVFEVKELPFNESLLLFNWHAFGQNPVTESYIEYVRSVVEHCGGLPLALQVLGSSLSGKSLNVWKSALLKLEAIPDSKIQKILRISYDSLQDDHDKQLFLDIACFFIGIDRNYITTLLDGCDFFTTVGIENLIDRSLLIVDERNKLMMHQMVREMGREIVRQESPSLGERSRLWHKDALDVLREKIGTKTVKGLTIDLQGSVKDKFQKTFGSPSKNDVDIESEAFTKMQKLKLLRLDYVMLRGDYRNFPGGLIWLRWHGFSLASLPMEFDLKRLVVLDMRFSKLNQIWKDKKCLPNLKILNLNHSHGLLKTPNFSGLPSLERLMLKDCINLTEVDPSIGELKRLIFLKLEGCHCFKRLPRTIGSLESLEELILSGCSRLKDVPKELKDCKSLRVLNLDKTALYESNSRLRWLLSLKRSKELGFWWAYLPCSLVKLSLESCGLSDDLIPNDLSGLPSLKFLNLSRNPIRGLPESICSLTKLDELQLAYCTELQSLPKLPTSLINRLHTEREIFLDKLSSLRYLFSFKRCVVFGCEKLIEVQDVFKMESIENFDVEQIKSLFNMDSVSSSKVQIYNYLTDTKIVASLKVLHECGITSTFILGSEVPKSFEPLYNKRPKISFSLPPLQPGEKIMWLNLCIVYSIVGDNIMDNFLPSVGITNESKETRWAYYSSFIGIPNETESNTMMTWLIHWPVSHRQLEGGDRMTCLIAPPALEIREFCIAYGLERNVRYESDLSTGNENCPRNVELQLLKEGFMNLGSTENFQVQYCNHLEDSNRAASLQAYYPTISGFSPLANVAPTLFPYSYHAFGSKMCFKVPPPSSQKISWLEAAILLFANGDGKTASEFSLRVEIFNETKQTKWTYFKSFVGIPEAKCTNILWLNSWKFTGELESGGNVSLTLLSDLLVVECGIDLIDEPNDNNVLSNFVFLLGFFTHLMFTSQRNLYRMQGLVKSC